MVWSTIADSTFSGWFQHEADQSVATREGLGRTLFAHIARDLPALFAGARALLLNKNVEAVLEGLRNC